MRRLARGAIRESRALTYRAAKKLLETLGYEVLLVRRYGGEAAEAGELPDAHAYTEWSTPTRMWTPWLADAEFQRVYDGVAPYTVVSIDRCYNLFTLARQARNLDGAFAECGVFQGGTALLLSRVLGEDGRKLYLFDSFEGLPEPHADKDRGLRRGLFKSASEDAVRKLLAGLGDRLDVRPGWIPQTFVDLQDERFAFVHVDVDLYQSTLDCCEFFYPRLVAGGTMVFDDHGFPGTRGMKAAVHEFFDPIPEVPLALREGQAIITKLATGEVQ